jgi:hypothetical protein
MAVACRDHEATLMKVVHGRMVIMGAVLWPIESQHASEH